MSMSFTFWTVSNIQIHGMGVISWNGVLFMNKELIRGYRLYRLSLHNLLVIELVKLMSFHELPEYLGSLFSIVSNGYRTS
jgi:hypothetical protein